jgi:hypothetical protein
MDGRAWMCVRTLVEGEERILALRMHKREREKDEKLSRFFFMQPRQISSMEKSNYPRLIREDLNDSGQFLLRLRIEREVPSISASVAFTLIEPIGSFSLPLPSLTGIIMINVKDEQKKRTREERVVMSFAR